MPQIEIHAGISSNEMISAAVRPMDMNTPKLRMLTMLLVVEIRNVAIVVTVVKTTGVTIRRWVSRLASRKDLPELSCS
ncbi:hypothetical protein D9M73_210770 [compost metagenome]